MFDMLVEPPPEPEPPDSVLMAPPVDDEIPPEDIDDQVDPELAAVGLLALQRWESDELSVDRLDADATLDRVEAARRRVNLAEVEQLDLAAHWADLHGVTARPDGPRVAGGERMVRLGGDGTPQVAEFAAAELGLALQVSENAAAGLMADALDLRHRFGLLWDLLHTGTTAVGGVRWSVEVVPEVN